MGDIDPERATTDYGQGQVALLRGLLICGVLSSPFYLGVDLVSGRAYDGYDFIDQQVSELSAIGAPTRPLWLVLGPVYQILMVLFGVGVRVAAGRRRSLRIAAALIIAYGVVGFAAPFTPMHTREYLASYGPTLAESLHLVGTGVAMLLLFTAIGFAAAAFGGLFRVYSIITVVARGREQPTKERTMTRAVNALVTLRRFARRHPVLSYYALVFSISWGGILILVGPGGIPGQPDDVARLFPFTLAALFAGPSLAGIVMTALVSGRGGLRELVGRLGRWRAGAGWWAAALLIGPILVAAVLFGLSIYSPDFVPGLLTSEDPIGLILFGLGWGLVGGGLLEELGWTGFAVPALRERHSVFTTGLIVGLLWGTWHLLIAFWSIRGLSGEASSTAFIAGFLAFYFVALPAYRVLMVWLYDNTASLLLAMLMHAVLSTSTIVLQPPSAQGNFTWNLLLGAALWTLVAGLAVTRRNELTRSPSLSMTESVRERQ